MPYRGLAADNRPATSYGTLTFALPQALQNGGFAGKLIIFVAE
jgi:hypothetical protein